MHHNSLVHLFEESAQKFSDNVMLRENRGDAYKEITYREALTKAKAIARGLAGLGLGRGERVALISEGRNDWVLTELAILYCGGISVPLSVKIEEPADLLFRLEHSGCKGVVVSKHHQQKVLDLLDHLTALSFVVFLDSPDGNWSNMPVAHRRKLFDIEELLYRGEQMSDNRTDVLDRIKEKLRPEDAANICYTSGTSADPKGIVLTHKNYLHNVEQASAIFDVPPWYTSLHILPWDHSFAHTVGIYSLIRNGASLASLKVGKTLTETVRNIPVCIREVRPHFLLSVPALAKNFRSSIENGVREKGPLAMWLFRLGLKTAYAYNREGHNRGEGARKLLRPLYRLFDHLLFKKVREGFGGRLEFFVGGGALLDIELQRFFYALGMPMFQGYGLTEAAPVISSNTPAFHKLGSSGKVVPWLDLKICGDDGQEKPIGEQGEIVVSGDNVMAGYWNNPSADSEALRNGWLYTGDLGYLDHEGYLYVKGRSKSLLIGSDGEKYSPEGIEEAMMEKSGFFDQVMLYNNQSPYTAGLIVINRAEVLNYLRDKGLDPATPAGQQAALHKLGLELSRFLPGGEFSGMFPQRWLPAATAFLSEPFSEKSGLMNSTMKIVRPAIHQFHKDTIAYLYTPGGKIIDNPRNGEVIATLSQ